MHIFNMPVTSVKKFHIDFLDTMEEVDYNNLLPIMKPNLKMD